MKLSGLGPKLTTEILSRAIDALWKQPSGNKSWITFLDLQDDADQTRCQDDTSGPRALKYCQDGGVYYVYNFVEHEWLGGWVDWPWGAEKLVDLGIDLRVSSLARS